MKLDTHITVNVSVQNLATLKYRVTDALLIAAIAWVLSRVPLVIMCLLVNTSQQHQLLAGAGINAAELKL